ncbi:MAG: RNA 2',3'-cyclic phosphodiesterase [Promethearchaeota archaeon]
MMAAIRCFIAIEVEDPDVLRQINRIQQELQSSGAKLKLVEPQNLHFTLHFLGNIDESRIDGLSEILQNIEGNVFEVELLGLGCFRPQRPRVIWIGCTGGSEQIIQHQKTIGRELRANRFPSEKRKYSPHLTVVRVRSSLKRDQLMEIVRQNENKDFGKFRVKSIKLKKSTLTPKGPIYEDLSVKSLNETKET